MFVGAAVEVLVNENISALHSESADASVEAEAKRQRSTIAFPYSDYDDAEKIAQAIHGNVGHGTCSLDQLASWTHQSSKSSTFKSQVAAARLFGLVESSDSESYKLTALGIRVVDQTQARAARADAFLMVPLFKSAYEKYKGTVLPPPAALERELVSLGVAEKQKARARQVLMASAEQTGFQEQGKNKLVIPAVVVPPPGHQPSKAATQKGGGEGGDGSGGGDNVLLGLDPLLMALLRKLPSKENGWPAEKRLRWFKTFAMNVSQVYDDDSDPVELTVSVGKCDGSHP